MFGVSSGLGMGFLTFDWTQITWIGSPLMIPWWAEVHIFVGFVFFYWIVVPAMYYSDVSCHLSNICCICQGSQLAGAGLEFLSFPNIVALSL